MNAFNGPTADEYYRQATELIGRYSNLSDRERRELTAIYSQLSPVEIALMISNEEIATNLDAFHREHRRRFRTPFRHYAVLVGIFLVGFALIAWKVALGG